MRNKTFILLLIAYCMMYSSCTTKSDPNPFFAEFQTPFNTPPFDEIKPEHYEPAFNKGIEEQNCNIQTIIDNKAAPTFENTIVALDNSAPTLDRVWGVFNNLTSAETNDELTALSLKLVPAKTEQADNIYLNKALFAKVDAVYQQKEALGLTVEQSRLLDKIHKRFLRSGANLDDARQARLREINKQLATLALTFDENRRNENNSYKLYVDDKADLAGLPDWFCQSAAEDAKADGQEGKWLFSIKNASRIPLLQYAANRTLREKIYKAYINCGNNGDANDNKAVIAQIIDLRIELANLLGFDCYANYSLDITMAKNAPTVMEFLGNLWQYALPKAKEEAAELQRLMDKEGKKEKLEGWDWWYYTEKLRKEKYDLDEDELKPYFKLENVRDGAFAVANKLYGITLTKLDNVQVYHPDVTAFEVKAPDGSHLGVLYVDYFPRPGKGSGAWMENYRQQQGSTRPVICNVCNFTKPVGDIPSLLTLDEVETLFHEFGHALHGLLSQCNYAGISGANVLWDFVELPSQIMEHWATEPEVLRMYAKHYQTGETIPDGIIEKITRLGTFNQGFITTELLAAALLDMNLHTLQVPFKDKGIMEYEKELMDSLGLIREIAPRYRSTYFGHIVGEYAAGYYSYLWANVLDSDAFEAFKEKGIFDKQTADLFRRNVLEKGDSEEPMTLYRNFRGAEPQLDPMLRNRGMK